MNYRYQKNQIFRKKLKAPKQVLERVYSSSLTFDDFIKYELEDKIPISCIRKKDRVLVEKFGIEKCKNLDWELINNESFYDYPNLREILLSLDSYSSDLNYELYKRIINNISPNNYTPRMKNVFKDRYFEMDYSKEENNIHKHLKIEYNFGRVSLIELINHWSLFENMNLDYCLENDYSNSYHIGTKEVKEFMKEYGNLASLIIRHGNIYDFINDLYSKTTTKEQKEEYIKSLAEQILETTIRKFDNNNSTNLSDEEYREIFKYASLENYLAKFSPFHAKKIVEELKTLPEDYIFNIPIPFKTLLYSDVLYFVSEFGLKNIVDFDNECGHFFSNDNCKILKLMYEEYVCYAGNNHNPKTNIFAPSSYTRYDSSGEYLGRGYTKDDFYESIRRMIMYRGSSGKIDYRTMTGMFKEKHQEIYISEEAPQELQKAFYTKSITPSLLVEHPEYIPYIKGKDLSVCFEDRTINVLDENNFYIYKNLYSFLSSKMEYEKVISFTTEYCDILDIIYDRNVAYSSSNNIEISINDNLDKLIEEVATIFKNIIIKQGRSYPQNIPSALREQFPSMFLSSDAPKELQDAFYNRTIDSVFILSNPSYKEYLKNIDLEILYGYIPVNISRDIYGYCEENLIKTIENIFGKEDALDLLLIYGDYIKNASKINNLKDFDFKVINSKDSMLDQLDKCIYKAIVYGNMKYDEKIPSHFKNNYPTLFLDKNIPQEIKDKFYSKKFTIEDFNDNTELLKMIGNTNVACGFSTDFNWIIPLFDNLEDQISANATRLKLIEEYSKIKNTKLNTIFKNYVINHNLEFSKEKIDCLSEVLMRLEYSNSIEIYSFREQMLSKLLYTEDPISSLEKIEKVFLQNNLPLCGKMFLCFKILYPDLDNVSKFSFFNTSRVAPELKDDSLPTIGFHSTPNEKRELVIFNDLLRIAYRSNERSFVEYLNNIETGNEIYLNLQNNNYELSQLTTKEKETLDIYVSHLEVLYQNTQKGKEKEIDFSQFSLKEKLEILSDTFKPNERYDLKDRIVRSFCYMAGIKSFDELKQLTTGAKLDQENRRKNFVAELERNGGKFKFEEGDFVRGFGRYEILGSTLNSGNVCKEHLGVFLGTSKTDTTPLDVDITLITNPTDIYHTIEGTPTGFGFGNLYVIFKHDNPTLNITRDKSGNLTGNEYDPRKIEMFGTSTIEGGHETHWGARTGFAFTDVDCILYKQNRKINSEKPYDENGDVNYEQTTESVYDDLPTIKFEIAKNGYYIPVIDFSGKLIFTEQEFNEIRAKMQGLSYYGETTYKLSDNLITPEVEMIVTTLTSEAEQETIEKRKKVTDVIKQVMDEFGVDLNFKMDNDLTAGTVEFIDTGSTGRKTNVPHDGDFDFFMRLDSDIMKNPDKLVKFKTRLREEIEKHPTEGQTIVTASGDFRFKGVSVDEETMVDIDISFGTKTNKVRYSSDECLKDRLSTIYELHPDEYPYVVSNIILAKKVLKEAGAYKPKRSDATQGGLGGVGIENWILQYGGSFEDAATSFLEAAEGKTFEEFKKVYQIWDFGENYFAERKGQYAHDEFVSANMSEEGYDKMKTTLNSYFKQKEINAMQEEKSHNNESQQKRVINK